jgi:hypothetical protein
LRFLRISWAGFRFVSSLFKQLASFGKIDRSPSPETLIQWELKIGLHKLERPKPPNEEWIWMADHVMRLGCFKCFVVVGVRMGTLRARRDLTVTLEDLEPMAILPMQTSNGKLVAQKLEATIDKVGSCPKGLVIDHGSDLYAGARLVAKSHEDISLKYDVCHKVACELKGRLNTEAWSIMTSEATKTRKALLLGAFAKFAPPQQRSKARYMNLDSLVNWGYNNLLRYSELPKKVREQTAWILPLKENIFLWKEWLQIGQMTRDTIRKEGFYEGVEEVLMDRIIALKLSERSEELIQVLIDYVEAESEGIVYEKRMIGSTEALEGLFGGYKRMVGENKMSINGLGRLILCMSSRIGVLSEEVVHEALTEVRCKDVESWLNRAFGKLVLEENQEHFIEENACNF